VDEVATVYVDRLYDDEWDGTPQPWPRRRRLGGRPWVAATGGTADVDDEGAFETVDEAIVWASERADIVLVRLGHDVEAVYSAGRRQAAWSTDGSGWRFPPWPPASWPRYAGPPERGWPRFPGDDGEARA
jgi:hypothetical protein